MCDVTITSFAEEKKEDVKEAEEKTKEEAEKEEESLDTTPHMHATHPATSSDLDKNAIEVNTGAGRTTGELLQESLVTIWRLTKKRDFDLD